MAGAIVATLVITLGGRVAQSTRRASKQESLGATFALADSSSGSEDLWLLMRPMSSVLYAFLIGFPVITLWRLAMAPTEADMVTPFSPAEQDRNVCKVYCNKNQDASSRWVGSSTSTSSTLTPISEEGEEELVFDEEDDSTMQSASTVSFGTLTYNSQDSVEEGRRAPVFGQAAFAYSGKTLEDLDETCLWKARSFMKSKNSKEWEPTKVWLDQDGVVLIQKEQPGAAIVQLFEGSFRARQLRYRAECTKPSAFALLPCSGSEQEVHFSTQMAKMKTFLGLVGKLQRERFQKEFCAGARKVQAVFGILVLMVGFGVVNNALLRIVLVFVGGYVHALSCSTNLASLVLSWGAVLVKASFGTEQHRGELLEMFAFARKHWDLFASIGVCEGFGFTLVSVAAQLLPQAASLVASQSVLPLSLLLGTLMGHSLSKTQIGCAIGPMLGIWAAEGALSWPSVGDFTGPIVLAVLAYTFLALSFVFKGVALTQSERSGHKLDLLFVEGVAAMGQFVALALQWPMNFAHLTSLPPRQYFQEIGEVLPGAFGLLVLYWTWNMLYRLVALRAVSKLSPAASL